MDRSSARIGFIQAPRFSTTGTAIDDSPILLTVEPAGLDAAPMLIDVIASAFLKDPTWSWAFPEPAMRKRFWKLAIDGALSYPWVFKTNNFEAVSVWIPPGGSEFLPEDEDRLPILLKELAGSRAADVLELLHRFGEAHPRSQPHYYLSLLGIGDAQAGRGLGMALLRENLIRIDAERMPAYLESSNPANNHRYESAGFVPVVSFRAPGDGPLVTGMWREPQ